MAADFYKLGIGEPLCISAIAVWIADLLDILPLLPKKEDAPVYDEELPRIII